jgi:hypothetical protein
MIGVQVRDLGLEAYLTTFDDDLTWEYLPSVDLSEIDLERGRRNNARVENALLPEKVREYTDWMKRGTQFPPVVLSSEGSLFHGLDGNNRLAAAEQLKRTSVDAYLVAGEDETLIRLTLSLNNRNGQPPTEEDRDKHVVTLHANGCSRSVISASLGMTSGRVNTAISIDKAHRRANGLGCKSSWAKITSKGARDLLSGNLDDDQVFIAFVELVGKFGLTRDEVRKIKKELLEQRSEQERIQFLAKERYALEHPKRGKSGPRENNPKAMLRAHLTYLIKNGRESWEVIKLGMSNAERQQLSADLSQLIDDMTKVLYEIGPDGTL